MDLRSQPGKHHNLHPVSGFFQDGEQTGEAPGVRRIEHIVEHNKLTFFFGEDQAQRESGGQEELFLLAAREVVQLNRFGQGIGLNAAGNKLVG